MVGTNIWDEILSRVQTKINRHSFYTWFKATSFISDDGSTVTVRVPDPSFKEWITKHYSGVISEAALEAQRPQAHIAFVTEIREPIAAPPTTWRPTTGAAIDPPIEESVASTPASGLNPRYSFDTFIVVVKSVCPCRMPSRCDVVRCLNPLFIYGCVGPARQPDAAIAILRHAPHRTTYISLERFMNEMINAVRSIASLLRERYRRSMCCSATLCVYGRKEALRRSFSHV